MYLCVCVCVCVCVCGHMHILPRRRGSANKPCFQSLEPCHSPVTRLLPPASPLCSPATSPQSSMDPPRRTSGRGAPISRGHPHPPHWTTLPSLTPAHGPWDDAVTVLAQRGNANPFLLFLSFWLPWVFVAALGLSLIVVHGLLMVDSVLRCVGSRGCGLQ